MPFFFFKNTNEKKKKGKHQKFKQWHVCSHVNRHQSNIQLKAHWLQFRNEHSQSASELGSKQRNNVGLLCALAWSSLTSSAWFSFFNTLHNAVSLLSLSSLDSHYSSLNCLIFLVGCGSGRPFIICILESRSIVFVITYDSQNCDTIN